MVWERGKEWVENRRLGLHGARTLSQFQLLPTALLLHNLIIYVKTNRDGNLSELSQCVFQPWFLFATMKHHDKKKPDWGGKGLFGSHTGFHHEGSQDGNSHKEGFWRWELMLRSLRDAAYWIAQPVLFFFIIEPRATRLWKEPLAMAWPSLISH